MKSNTQAPPLAWSDLVSYEPHLALTHVGDYDAVVMVFSVDIASVRTVLPADLELTTQGIVPVGKHPVLLYVGQQSQVRGVLVPSVLCPWLSPLGLCMEFLEAAIAVPFVRRVGALAGGPEHFCATRLYLNELLPIYLGWLCGFPKVKGNLSRTSSSYDVRTTTHSPLLNLVFKPQGSYQHPSAYPHFAALRPMLEQPHIGQLFSLSTPLLSTFVCSAIDLRLNTARIRPVSITGTLTPAFSTILPTNWSIDGIHETALGAFQLRTSWELPPPYPC